MLVDNEALGQSDSRWTLEWLNKSRRWVSLLWLSPVSHLFIAPLSLISSHCLPDWHKSICFVVPTWCLVHLPLCLCAVKLRHLSSTCGTWAKMPFEVPKTYGQCLDIHRQMCSRNSSSRQFPGQVVALYPDSNPLLWPGSEQQLLSLQQVAWRKVLTRPQTVGLSMQGQSTSNRFRDTQMDLQALTHTWS